MTNSPISRPNDEHAHSVEDALAQAVARAAELVAEVEERSERLDAANHELAAANVRAAELVVELQSRREELEWANASLRQVDESNRRLLRVAAHDLRGGLAGVDAMLELGDTASARTEVDRLARLLEELLGESRQDLDHVVLRAQVVRLEGLLDDAVRAHQPAALRKEQTIRWSCVPDEVRLDADPIRLRQVVDNLLSNAVKFGPRGGAVSIEATEVRGAVTLTIRDEGQGFEAEDLERVFGEFEMLSARPTAGESSHGIGLSIVRRIVEAHGGTVTARNRTDRSGAEFRIDLPAPVQVGCACRILVVDDEAVNRRYLRAQLERVGHTVEECEDGQDAVFRILNAAPDYYDLALLDLEMPILGGLDVLRRVRSMGGDRVDVPFVVVTGHTDSEVLSDALDAGASDLVIKPLRSPGVRCLLRRWCVARGSASAAPTARR